MRFFRTRLFRFILSVFCLFLVITALFSLRDVLGKRHLVGDRTQQLTAVQEENAKLKEKLAETKTEAFIEREARDKLGLVKPDEIVVVVPKPEAQKQATQELKSHWKQWWGLFF